MDWMKIPLKKCKEKKIQVIEKTEHFLINSAGFWKSTHVYDTGGVPVTPVVNKMWAS